MIMGKFKIENGTSLDEAVGITVGAGSMCWENVAAAGEFQSTEAAAIVQELIDAIRDGRVRDGQFGVKVSRWQPIGPDGTIHAYVPPDAPVPTAHDTREVDGG
jgi:hypothetical protein